MDFYTEVNKVLFADGFHKGQEHGLWKLKNKLSREEWERVKHLFNYYSRNDKECSNCKYYGWMTTAPVEVMLQLKDVRLENERSVLV